jgi:hypothetical protein
MLRSTASRKSPSGSRSGRTGSCRLAVDRLEDRVVLVGTPLGIFTGVGAEAAKALAQFKAALGGADNGGGGPAAEGFRSINWDGVKLDGTDFGGQSEVLVPNATVGIPVNRFQSRGVIFKEEYAVSGDGFASTGPGVGGQIAAFSPTNTFAMFGNSAIDLHFVVPSDPSMTSNSARQAVRGFGAIFIDVESYGTSSIELDAGSRSLGTFFVPPGPSGQAEFVGVLFDAPVVTDVHLVPGTASIFAFLRHSVFGGDFVVPGLPDVTNRSLSPVLGPVEDLAATDDFVYAEPTTLVEPTPRPFLEQAYIDLLHRGLDPAGAADFGALLSQGASHTEIARAIEQSAEFQLNLVQGLYGRLLHRVADPDGLNAQLQLLAQTNAQWVKAAMIAAPESFQPFKAVGEEDNDALVRVAYDEVLKRGVDPAGTEAWGQRFAAGGTLSQVAFEILRSPEGASKELDRLYQAFLGRPVDPAGLDAFQAGLTDGLTEEAVVALLVGSAEYADRP